MTDPTPIRGRWTITIDPTGEARSDHDITDTVSPTLGWRAIEVVPAPDEQAIERAIRALDESNWRSGSLTISTRMLVDAVLTAALGQPDA